MPLPWKKSKVSRLSRLMVDLQSPPKRGGSLVVQTGFPTSIVDLFVKNRDRLKKPSKKKLQSQPHLEISKPVMLPAPQAHDNVRTVNLASGSEEDGQKKEITTAQVEELVVVEQSDPDVVRESEADPAERWKKRCVLVAVLRVFLVVVLALSTKWLAVGITMSAFLLLMLEYVGTRVLFYFRPCFNATSYFVGEVKVLCLYKCKDDVGVLSLEKYESCEKDSKGEISNDVGHSSVEEIHVVQSNSVVVASGEEIRKKEMNTEIISGDGRDKRLDVETTERIVHKNEDNVDVSVYKEQRGKTKIKANFLKKYFPKKLRSTKKDKKSKEKEMDSSSDTCSREDEDKLEMIDHKQERVDGDESSRFQLLKEEERGKRHEEVDDGIASFSTQSQSEVEVITVKETLISERKGNSGYLMLCSIVLSGLVGGRFLALVLTLAWCLMLKLARKLRPVKPQAKSGDAFFPLVMV